MRLLRWILPLTMLAVLGQPAFAEDTGPATTHVGVGPLVYLPIYFHEPYLGVELQVSLRPEAAQYFYPSFAERQIGIGLQIALVELTPTRGFINANIMFRKYLADVRSRPGEDAAFVGVGFGIVGIFWDNENVGYRNVALAGEVGYEYKSFFGSFVTLRAQARYLKAGPINFNGVGITISVGWRVE